MESPICSQAAANMCYQDLYKIGNRWLEVFLHLDIYSDHGGHGPAKSVTRARAINIGKDMRATNVKNYEDATMTTNMKGMGVNQTTQGAQLRLARRKYE